MTGGLPPSYEHPGSPPARPELPAGVERPPREPGDSPAPEQHWPLWSPLAALAATLFVAILGVGVLSLIAELAGAEAHGDEPLPGVTIGGTVIQDLALVGSALVFAHLTSPPLRAAQLGLRIPRPASAAGWTLLVWLGFFAFSAIWSVLLGIDESDDLPEELGADESTLALIAVALLVCVVAPIAEELFFRGFCFTALRNRAGMLPAAVLTGVIFGGIHLGGTDIEFIVPLMVFGALLCLLYAWSGSILPCIVLHALNNALALGVSLEWGAATVAAMAGSVLLVLSICVPIARRAAPEVATG